MNMSTSFCMDVGQVKTGDDKDDTYVKMLQEIVRVTAPMAYGIAAKYPNVTSLVKRFRQEGPSTLEDLKVGCACYHCLFSTAIGSGERGRLILLGLHRNRRIRMGHLRNLGLGRR